MRNSSLAKLQTAMRQAVDSTELAYHSHLYQHELIDKLQLYVNIERIAVDIKKMIGAGELRDDDIFYTTHIEPVMAIRKEGVEEALVYFRPPVVEVDTKESKIAALLQKHKVTIEDIDNYQTTSSYILQKIIKPSV